MGEAKPTSASPVTQFYRSLGDLEMKLVFLASHQRGPRDGIQPITDPDWWEDERSRASQSAAKSAAGSALQTVESHKNTS